MFGRVEILRCTSGEKSRAWRDALAGLTEARLIKQEQTPRRVAAVYRATLLGSQVAIKVAAPLGVRGTLCKLGLALTRARRAWNGAQILRAAGIETAEPFALAVARWQHPSDPSRTLWAELVAMEWLDGRTLLETMARSSAAERCRVARALGRLTSRLTASMVLNRDHKPSNIVVLTPEGNADPTLALIDTDGIRTGVLADRASVRMLRDLVLEPIGVGVPPTTRDVVCLFQGLREGGFWADNEGAVRLFRRQLARSVVEAVEEHGDPTPKVNPLAAG